jgi:hypothetical protein
MVFIERTGVAEAGIRKSASRGNLLQGIHEVGAAPVRHVGGGLCFGGIEGGRENSADSQGAIVELHEIAECAGGIANQLP